MRTFCLLAIALFVLPLGCSPYAILTPSKVPLDPRAPLPEGVGEICVVRPGTFGLWATQVVRDNGTLVGATRGRGWFCYRTGSGPHRVASMLGVTEAVIEVDLRSGQRVFLEQAAAMHGPEIARAPEARALQEISELPYAELVAAAAGERVLDPGALVSGTPGPPPAPAPPPAPRPTRRRPDGTYLSLAAGIGGGFARTALLGNSAPSERGAVANAAYTTGFIVADIVQIGLTIDAVDAVGHGVIGASVRTAVFPGARGSGSGRDFSVFLDLGAAGETSASPPGTKHGGLFLGTLGLGWEGWRTGLATAGPFIAGKLGRGDENLAAVLLGMRATLFLGEKHPDR